MSDEFEVVASGFKRTSDVPKDEDLSYRCTDCGAVIPSVPDDNIGCECGNVFIDKDYWRLIVVDLSKLEVVKRKQHAEEELRNRGRAYQREKGDGGS